MLRLIGCCFLSMLWGFGINLPLFIICSIGLVVLLVYTTYDILTVKDDRDYLTIDVQNLKKKIRGLEYTNRILQAKVNQVMIYPSNLQKEKTIEEG